MSKLIFNADKTGVFDARVSAIGPNQIRVVFNSTVPEERILYSGFVVINEYNGLVEADYSDYKYKYRDVEEPHTFDLSNDGIPYTPTVSMKDMDKGGEVINFEHDEEEGEVTFDKDSIAGYVESKISDLSEECKEEIEKGTQVMINDIVETFSYSLADGDQNNIDDMFNSMMQTKSGQYYHADGKPQQYFEPYQIYDIYSSLKLNKLNKIARYNQLVLMLRNMFSEDKEYTADDTEYIEQVSFKSTKLKGDFHKNYIANRTQNEDQMEALKQNLIANGIEFPKKEESDKK